MKIAGISMVIGLSLLLSAGATFAQTFTVPDTGQTDECFEESGGVWNKGSCTNTSGQDGNALINPPSFKSYNANGDEVPNLDATAVVVKDEVTGLYWELKTDDENAYHGVDETYFFSVLSILINNISSDTNYNWINVADWEWRVPTREELRSILNYQYGDGSTVAAFEAIAGSASSDYPLIGAGDGYYWSADYVDPNDPTLRYWLVSARSHADDIFQPGGASPERYCRLVYGPSLATAQTRDDFSVNGDIVTDNRTLLDWEKVGVTQAEGAKTWTGAIQYCSSLTLGDKAWRLPTIKELESIIDVDKTPAPRIDDQTFTAETGSYWSSTTALNPSEAWAMNFNGGKAESVLKTTSYYVRCVAGGDVQTYVKCDFNDSGTSTIDDAIIALKICAGIDVSLNLPGGLSAHCVGDETIGIEEAICALQWAAGVRQ